jgi:hypothetical protein
MGSVPKFVVLGLGQLSVAGSTAAMAPTVGFRPSVSAWHIVSNSSSAISIGLAIDVTFGSLRITLANSQTGQVITLTGPGGGGGVSTGPKFSVSGDPPPVPGTPSLGFLTTALRGVVALLGRASINSPVYVVPGRVDSAQLFMGLAQIVTLSAAAIGEANASVIVFYDNFGIKAFAFLAGVDLASDVSVGVDDIVYTVSLQS